MPAGNKSTFAKPGSRLRELDLVLPTAATPLGAYVEASEVGLLLFLSGILPVVNGKLSITGRLGEDLSVEQGREGGADCGDECLEARRHFASHSGRTGRLVRRRCEATYCPLKQPARGTQPPLLVLWGR